MFFSRKSDQEEKPDPIPPPTLPARPPGVQKPIGFETVIGPGCTLEGTLRSNGNLRMDGTFNGTLEISGNILVGETSRIEADVNAQNISIAGMVRGNVSGNKVQLLRTARVWGDITATALTTEEGAFIDGKISMSEPPPMAEAPAVALDEDLAEEVVAEVVEMIEDEANDLDEPPFVADVIEEDQTDTGEDSSDNDETEETSSDDEQSDDD